MNTGPGSLLTNIAYRLDYPAERLHQAKKKMFWFSIALIGLVSLLSVAAQFIHLSKFINTYWINTFTHSLFESYCGLISLTIGYVIYKEYRASGKRSIFYLLMAFISMAVFDFAHAYSNHCVSLFVWFHTLSAFSGGAFFLWGASVKKDVHDPRWRQRLFLISGVIAIIASVAELVYLLPLLPDAVVNEAKHHMPVTVPFIWNFSDSMIVLNALSAICFLFAGVKFYRYFKVTDDVIYFVFSLASFLFFESELLFAMSNLWNVTWWYWHVIKLFIFIGLSIGLAHGLIRSFRELYESRKKLSSTVDELKHAYDHLKNTQEELLESEKLASIGKMAATISHEIRNPLGAIKNSAGIFKRHARLAPEDEELLNIIGKEINRLDHFISEFLEFAKPHPLKKSTTDLNELVDETIALLAHHDKSHPLIHFSRSFDSRLPRILLDRNTIKQVLWNILINAVQAMPDGGTVTIKTVHRKPSGNGHSGEISIVIADSGTGMSPEITKKVFQPFFSTKSKGTGLGLSIVERTIKKHGGRVSLESTIGQGTSVSISLPLDAGETRVGEAFNDVVYFNS